MNTQNGIVRNHSHERQEHVPHGFSFKSLDCDLLKMETCLISHVLLIDHFSIKLLKPLAVKQSVKTKYVGEKHTKMPHTVRSLDHVISHS